MLNWLSYPRGVFATLFGIVWTLIMSVVVVFLAGVIRRRGPVDRAIIIWSMPIIFLAGVKVEMRGGDLVRPDGKGFLILFNHSSLMDIPILYAYFPRSFRFGAKIELFKIPFFGKVMELCGVLPIDRRNRNKVMKVYEQAIARVNNGECFALAPEGTRQSEPKLGSFKRGPFEFAINAEMPVVPVVLAGVYDVLTRNGVLVGAGRWRHRVILQITPPVDAATYALEKSVELQERVREQMLPVHTRLHQELAGRP
jgi:1-acyl-sn-glycerol-3-phosphate acyltransferase